MNTILKDIKKLASTTTRRSGNYTCELTSTVGNAVEFKFDNSYYLVELFPYIANEIEANRDHLGIGSYYQWIFSKSILDLTPQELKAKVTLGLITLG